MRITLELEALCLESLEQDWVHAIYDTEFLECGELSAEYEALLESVDVQKLLDRLVAACEECAAGQLVSWATLSHEIDHRKLLAVLFYFIDRGHRNVLTAEYREQALAAARVYYGLLSLPGYKAYGIYHAQLFTHSLLCLGFPKALAEQADVYYNTTELVREVNRLLRRLCMFVRDLKAVMRNLQLQPTDMNFEEILGSLLDVTGGAVTAKLNIDKLALAQVAQTVYECLEGVLASGPGAVRALFKCLLPKLLAASADNRACHNLARASYVTYTGVLLQRHGRDASDALGLLLQHLCHDYHGLERAEARAARASLAAGLASLLQRHERSAFVAWLLRLSGTARASHRHLAMELLWTLLQSELDDAPSQEADEGAEGESSGGVACAEADVLQALVERTHDASGSLRARALALLGECVHSDRRRVRDALERLNGTGSQPQPRLLSLAARCLSDERAVVRRAAAALLDALASDADLGVLVAVCRDASVLVRATAVTALGERALRRPCAASLDAFLAGPLHQLADPEAKVQEQVVSLVRQLAIEPLRPRPTQPALEAADELPWTFLAAVTRHNMRRHLQKACAALAKAGGCINHRTIDALSTHACAAAGEVRVLHALVLLSCVARHVDYAEPDFLLELYYALVAEQHPPTDPRLLPLALELLGEWSCWLREEPRRALRDSLLRCLREGLPAAAPCRSACAALAAHLAPDDLHWATDLMHAFAARALAGEDAEAWLCAADVSLVAPGPPPDEFVRRLVATVAEPSPAYGAGAGVDAASASRARLVAALGRLCLRSRATAQLAAPALADTMSCCDAPLAARLNALLALTDICTRYTCIVEPLLGTVCAGLEPGAPAELRRAAARSLTRLLLGGFLRLRPPLYYRYVSLLADEQKDVREPAEYYVSRCLAPDAICGHVVDCVRHYSAGGDYGLAFESRQLIYDVMLQRLSPVQRLNVQCRLARELLAHAADLCDEGEPLPDALHAALLDTIALLCGPRMRLPRKPAAPEAADIGDLTERVTTNIVSHKMKRTVAEVVVPAVLRLHARLRPSGGQLVAYLVRFATDLLSDYRHEIQELVETDEELVERVRHFQETVGAPWPETAGNARNLVTASTAPEPDTPLAPRRGRLPRSGAARPQFSGVAKRLRV